MGWRDESVPVVIQRVSAEQREKGMQVSGEPTRCFTVETWQVSREDGRRGPNGRWTWDEFEIRNTQDRTDAVPSFYRGGGYRHFRQVRDDLWRAEMARGQRVS